VNPGTGWSNHLPPGLARGLPKLLGDLARVLTDIVTFPADAGAPFNSAERRLRMDLLALVSDTSSRTRKWDLDDETGRFNVLGAGSHENPAGMGRVDLGSILPQLASYIGALLTGAGANLDARTQQVLTDVQSFLTQSAADATDPGQIRTEFGDLLYTILNDLGIENAPGAGSSGAAAAVASVVADAAGTPGSSSVISTSSSDTTNAASPDAVVKQLLADFQSFVSQLATDAGNPDQIKTDLETFLTKLEHDLLLGLAGGGTWSAHWPNLPFTMSLLGSQTGQDPSLPGTANSENAARSVDATAAGSTGTTAAAASNASASLPAIATAYEALLGAMQQFDNSGSNSPSFPGYQNLVGTSPFNADLGAAATDAGTARAFLQLNQLMATEFTPAAAPLSNPAQALVEQTSSFLTQPHHG
jgi:hypothetical protein